MFTVEDLKTMIKELEESPIENFQFENSEVKLIINKGNKERASVSVKELNNDSVKNELEHGSQPSEDPENTKNDNTEETVKEKTIVSPMVGKFYSSPDPDTSSYVNTGDQVTPESVVCVVEAMKLFNEVEAGIEGEIEEVLVSDGDIVEYGQPLFKVK
ncbi:acetyl-CoA carboxylase biotin carboxyl carrier protein [Thalassorhabdus alkalitolerans]|uniref:Biotin carboxyl carrier protein of acetyl-CoA carboxylase n=1 Tax=Thalassorhabdus alkalitolerans TaxID=2282697 RepID=A0ABW0YHU8_9BACI